MANVKMDPGTAGGGRPAANIRRFPAGVLGSDNVVPVVLEFEQPPVAVYKRNNPQADLTRYQAELETQHQEFISRLASTGMDIQVGKSSVVVASPSGTSVVSVPHDFTHVFNGMGVLLPGSVVAQVAHMAGVRTVTLNEERVYLNLDKSVPFTGAPQLWQRLDEANRNIKGEGVLVAVIDTGIDYTHPEFGGFTEVPNDKVVLAVSYTGEAPIDNFGHGTHVACIIAGDTDYKGTPRGDAKLNGMAPKAKLMGYKVLSASGSGSATNIILAMEDAVKKGAHVMNLSLGDSLGDPLSPESSAANNAMLAGVIVCVAAGNSGPEPSSIGAPGAAHQVITVGASTDPGVTVLVARLSKAGSASQDLEMRPMEGSAALPNPALDLQYVACGLGRNPKEFPKEIQGHIALVQRGETTFREKALAAEKAGAVACVIYNNRDGGFFGSIGEEQPMPQIPVVAISKADGELMLNAFEKGSAVSSANLQLSPEEVAQPDRIAEFSSRGPNNDQVIKPELTAPGVNILSATILQAALPGGGMPDASGYVSASGTSMATPHVAGASALLRQAHPDWNSLQIKVALVNTARWMARQGTVMDQGNGAIDLMKAIDAKAILVTATNPISPTFSFGRVAHEGKERSIAQPLVILPLQKDPDRTNYKLSVEIAGQPDGMKAELAAGATVCSGEPQAAFNLTLSLDGAKLHDGPYYGHVVAEADWGILRLPFYVESVKFLSDQPNLPQQPRRREAIPPLRRRVGEMPLI
jgi:minor extracellular serine protease Vpr